MQYSDYLQEVVKNLRSRGVSYMFLLINRGIKGDSKLNVCMDFCFFKALGKKERSRVYVAGLESIPTPQAIGKPQC